MYLKTREKRFSNESFKEKHFYLINIHFVITFCVILPDIYLPEFK